MTAILDGAATRPSTSPSERLRTTTAAARVAFTWFGVRKTLTPEQKEQAAESFGAEGEYLSAGKKLLDTKHAAYKAVTAIRGQVSRYWKGLTLPFPEPGIRLIRQHDISAFDMQMTSFRAELNESVTTLDEHFTELKSAARRRLGSFYSASDYPASLRGMFGLAWEFPSVEAPEYLRDLSPALYEQECERAASKFDEAVQLAEQAFASELGKLVSRLTERLTGQEDGRPKVFRDSAIENFNEFFQRFRTLNIRSNADLDTLVEEAHRAIQRVQPQDLRDSQALREQVSTDLTRVQASLDGLLVDRPRRNILRRSR